MIDPRKINLESLPWLPLEEKGAFPNKSAIYFAIDSYGTVQYIGRSVNVRQRWRNHHKYDALSAVGGVRIAYLFFDAVKLLPEIEAALINWFEPPLNGFKFRRNQRTVGNLIIRLKELRERHPDKPSQRVVGDYLGIAEGNYRRLENGYAKSISFESIEKLCKFFSCTPNDIFEYIED